MKNDRRFQAGKTIDKILEECSLKELFIKTLKFYWDLLNSSNQLLHWYKIKHIITSSIIQAKNDSNDKIEFIERVSNFLIDASSKKTLENFLNKNDNNGIKVTLHGDGESPLEDN